MTESNGKGIFSKPLFRTRISSANVKPKEMLFGFFIGPMGALLTSAIFGNYLNRYFTDVLGLTDTARYGMLATLLPLFSVILIVLGNIIVGMIIDRIKTSQGKARPLLLLSAPIMAIAIMLLFTVPRGNNVVEIVWICIAYNLFYSLAYPIYYMSHSMILPLSTRNAKQRGFLSVVTNTANIADAGFIAAIVFPMLLGDFLFSTEKVNNNYEHWIIVMGVIAAITFFAILLEYFFTRERITEENIKLNIIEKKIPIKKQLKAVTSNKFWWITIAFYLLFQFGGAMKNMSMTYYAGYVQTTMAPGLANSILGIIGGVPLALGMLFSWPLAKKIGKKNSIVLGLIIGTLGGLVSFIDTSNLYVVAVGVALKGLGAAPATYVMMALFADVLDHCEAKNGFRCDGLSMSLYGAIMVGLVGIVTAILNSMLSSVNYNAFLSGNMETEGAVKNVIVASYLIIELVCYAILGVLLLFLNVEKYIKKDRQTILDRQKAAVLDNGDEWIEPDERLRMEQEQFDKLAEDARKEELKLYCAKKGISFEEREKQYQQKQQLKKEKAEARAKIKKE